MNLKLICSSTRNGKSKGIAYIEFEDVKAASAAVMKMDQKEFMDRVLTVAISAPPAASKPNTQSFSSSRVHTARPEQKSRISFVPASVQKAAATKDSPVPSPSQTAMSNDDFRKMLMK